MVMGTAQYISPNRPTVTRRRPRRTYSLGVVGYEALTGRRPFLGDGAITIAMKHIREAPPPLPPSLPAEVRELIETTLAKGPPTALRQRRRVRLTRWPRSEPAAPTDSSHGGGRPAVTPR